MSANVPGESSYRVLVDVTRATAADLPAALARALAGACVVEPFQPDDRPSPSRSHGAQPVPELPAGGVLVATSGSTGPARTVMLSAAAVQASARATHDRLEGPGDWVCALPIQHVAGMMTVARAVVAQRAVRFARRDLADLPEPGECSYLSVVGAQLFRVLETPELVARLAGYAAVLVGGSAVSPALVRRAEAAGIRLVVTYGMAETCGGCVYDGVPLADVRVSLAGDRITLAGPMVFSGYRLDPAATAAVLRGDSVLTRDRGRWVDGRLEVIGRLDDVVISGGVNVDLAAAQRACDEEFGTPEQGGVVMLAVPDERWGQRVVAVTTSELGLAQVGERLRPHLGPAALPRELRRVLRLAYTSTGKIDRVALQRDWEAKG